MRYFENTQLMVPTSDSCFHAPPNIRFTRGFMARAPKNGLGHCLTLWRKRHIFLQMALLTVRRYRVVLCPPWTNAWVPLPKVWDERANRTKPGLRSFAAPTFHSHVCRGSPKHELLFGIWQHVYIYIYMLTPPPPPGPTFPLQNVQNPLIFKDRGCEHIYARSVLSLHIFLWVTSHVE